MSNTVHGSYLIQFYRFVESEQELDNAIKSLQALTQAPLLYPHLVSFNTLETLLQLLSHENLDIALEVVTLINEWLGDDVGAQQGEQGEMEREAVEELARVLIRLKVEEPLMACLERCKDEMNDEDQRQGVFDILSTWRVFCCLH